MDRGVLGRLDGASRVVAWSVSLGLLATLAEVIQMAALAHIVASAFVAHNDLLSLHAPFAILSIAALCRASLLGLREALGQIGTGIGTRALRHRLLAHLVQRGPIDLRQERTGDLAATAIEGVDRLAPYVARYRPQVVLSVLVPLLIGAAVATRDWTSAAILLATAPVLPLLMFLVGVYAERHIRDQWAALARMNAHFLDMIQGLTTIKAFGRGAAARANVARVSTSYADRTLGTLRYAFLSALVLEFITAGAIALVAIALVVRLLAGGIGFESAFFVLLLTPEFYRPLRELGQHRHAAMEARAPAERIGALLGTREPGPEGPWQIPTPKGGTEALGDCCPSPRGYPEKAEALIPSSGSRPFMGRSVPWPFRARSQPPLSPATSGPDPMLGIRLPPGITFHGVRYAYPGADREALAGIDLVIPAGARIALVGRSGAGKSTLLYLLLRFIEPSAGRITVDGQPLDQIPAARWREGLAYLPQRPFLFAGTVHENIALGRPEATRAAVREAAVLAGLADVVGSLPQGYDTPLGERGARLSGGEAQRLALARAFLKDAPLLLLDEPTAHLDPGTEAEVRATFERLMAGRTVLLAAHRLNTVVSADQIILLSGGSVAEHGPHHDLVARGGIYAGLAGAHGGVPR